MKTKVILSLILFVFATGFSHAQKKERRLSFAITAEPHLNWLHADETFLETGKVRPGFGAGVRFDYRFQRSYAISFGVNWNQTGGNLIYKDQLVLNLDTGSETLLGGTRVTYNMQFWEIPVALKIVLPEIGYSTWFLEAGIDPMYNYRTTINTTDNNIDHAPFQQGVSKFNIAWHAGPGFNYSLGGRVSLRVALIYKNTFLDVTMENSIRKPDNTRINQVGLNLGIVF